MDQAKLDKLVANREKAQAVKLQSKNITPKAVIPAASVSICCWTKVRSKK